MNALPQARKGLPFVAFLVLAVASLIFAPTLAQAIGETAPEAAPAGPLPEQVAPFILQADAADKAQAARCMAEAIYYEAGFEPLDGQRAVAQVIVNRVRDPNFPSSVCGVVYQGWQRKTGCQFSFVCDGSLKRRPPSAAQLYFAGLVAEQALDGYVDQAVGAATHYHTNYVDPYWAPTLVQVAQVGSHIFYKWPGNAGRPAALTQAYAGGEVAFWRATAAQLGVA